MLTLARAALKRVPRPSNSRQSIRSFAEVVGTPPSQGSVAHGQKSTVPLSQGRQQLLKDRISVKEDHGLYGFFRRKDDSNLVGDARFEVVETPERMQHATGRSWKASELRLKSFEDLHTLWYILLRERNLLATQKEEARRMGVTDTGRQVSLDRVHHCRKSMARIKAVINERRLAYEGAVRLVERQREQHQDNIVLQHQVTQYRKERKYLQRRRLFMERRNATRQSMQQAREIAAQEQHATCNSSETTDTTVTLESKKKSEEKVVGANLSLEGQESNADTSPKQPTTQEAEPATLQADSKNEKEQVSVTKKGKVQTELPKPTLPSTPSNPIDAAAAGLFGVVQAGKGSRRR